MKKTISRGVIDLVPNPNLVNAYDVNLSNAFIGTISFSSKKRKAHIISPLHGNNCSLLKVLIPSINVILRQYC